VRLTFCAARPSPRAMSHSQASSGRPMRRSCRAPQRAAVVVRAAASGVFLGQGYAKDHALLVEEEAEDLDAVDEFRAAVVEEGVAVGGLDLAAFGQGAVLEGPVDAPWRFAHRCRLQRGGITPGLYASRLGGGTKSAVTFRA
jgi:hypothetical protein